VPEAESVPDLVEHGPAAQLPLLVITNRDLADGGAASRVHPEAWGFVGDNPAGTSRDAPRRPPAARLHDESLHLG
jgi:hypothetical protein